MKTKLFMLLAGIVLLASCSRSKSKYEIANTSASAADTARNYSAADSAASPKLVKTAEMRFKVKSVDKASEEVSALTSRFNGMITHHQMNSAVESSRDIRKSEDSIMRVTALNTTADITVKVPSEKLDDFMTQAAKLGTYVSLRRMDIEDKTLDYLSARLKLQSRKEVINGQKKGKVVIKHAEDVMALKDDMIDQQINNQRIDLEVKYSVVSLSIYQNNTISTEVIANDNPDAYRLSFITRVGQSLGDGWDIFKELIITLCNLWVLIIIVGGAFFIFRRYKRRADETKPLPAV